MSDSPPTTRDDKAQFSTLQGPALLRAGIPHAFTTRAGGVSSGIFASLNFGNPSDLPAAQRDPASNIRANLARVLAAIDPGAPAREIVEVHQVHGATVHTVHAGAPAHPSTHTTKADAIVTPDPARALAVRVADCAPVLIASTDGRVVSAVHAGWRGVISGVLPAAIDAMRALGATDIIAAVGPCIGFDRFEIGPEVADEFHRVFGPRTPLVRPARDVDPAAAPDRSLADLKGALRLQLERAGARAIDVLPHCTASDPALFFSHRRDKGLTGRMIGIIAPRISPPR